MALAHPLHPIRGKLGYTRQNLWVDQVFSPDDLCSGPYTQSIVEYIPRIIAAFLVIEISSL